MDASDNFFSEIQDLVFHIKHYPWDSLVPLMPHFEHEDKDSIRQDALAIMETLGSLIAKEFAPLALQLSEEYPSLVKGEAIEGPLMKGMVEKLAEMGAMSSSVSPEWGGMGMPLMLGHTIVQLLGRMSIPLANVFAYYLGGLKTLEAFHGIHDFSEQIRQLAAGQALGAMALTEPQAGSDLSQIRTRASKKEEGSWTLRGQKIWITCGHAQHHFVLARSRPESEAAGLKGLSLFYVHAFRKDGTRNIEIGGLEDKIGHHPIITASINYNDSEAVLLGQEGEGFTLMLHLMNHARISTASIALGACEKSLRTAKNYAKQRITMGKPIAEHPMIAEYLQDMESTTCGLRALLFECLYHEDMEFRLRIKSETAGPEEKPEIEKKLKHHYWQARQLTPLVKFFGAEESVRLSRMAIQILGGVGYMKEYGLGHIQQDSLLLPIYEGTSQIQSLMVLKDRLKDVLRSPSQFAQETAKLRYTLLSEFDPLQRQVLKLRQTYNSFLQIFLLDILAGQWKELKKLSWKQVPKAWKKAFNPKEGFDLGLKHAERFAKVTSYLACAEILIKRIDQAPQELKAERKKIAEDFLRFYGIRATHALNELKQDTSAREGFLPRFRKTSEASL